MPEFKNIVQLQIFLVTWFLSEIFLFLAIRLANRWSLHDKPDGIRKIHTAPIPTIGGLPIFVAFFTGIYFTQEGMEVMSPILTGAFICMLLGLVDDIKPISAVIKLIVLFAVTLGVYAFSDVTVRLTPWDFVNIILSLIWVVGMMSAINSLDNLDGLAAGITAIACLFIFSIAWVHWDRWLSFMAVALLAGCLTFLKYNFFQPKSGIFLGDNGSYFIGFVLACMAMMGAWTNPKIDYSLQERLMKAVLVPPLLLGVPIFDIITATVLRLVNGEVKTVKEAIVYCGKDHTSHRLVALGFTRRQAVIVLWTLGVALGIVSLLIQGSGEPQFYIPLALLTIALLVFFAVILNKAKVYSHQFEDGVVPDI
jgi:UDP-GlcNAc:undecaprenyl-phosphate/decaprenyl-phosphate GlcNAc-1-phosphate transferase